MPERTGRRPSLWNSDGNKIALLMVRGRINFAGWCQLIEQCPAWKAHFLVGTTEDDNVAMGLKSHCWPVLLFKS
jgi:hypothetical protein